jgi:hypothetical protein
MAIARAGWWTILATIFVTGFANPASFAKPGSDGPGRPHDRKSGRFDEHRGDVGVQEGAEAVADSGGGVRDHAGGHPEVGGDEYSGLVAHGTGLQVAQINGDNWAITARGFDGQYSNKLLVLIDGRTAYSPILSGVYWNAEDVPLHTIERIEVIRGPGAAVWGANAVNGVINITTFKASSTQGGLLSAGVGSYEQGFGSLRYGGTIGNETAYRVVAGGFNRGRLRVSTGRMAKTIGIAFMEAFAWLQKPHRKIPLRWRATLSRQARGSW